MYCVWPVGGLANPFGPVRETRVDSEKELFWGNNGYVKREHATLLSLFGAEGVTRTLYLYAMQHITVIQCQGKSLVPQGVPHQRYCMETEKT